MNTEKSSGIIAFTLPTHLKGVEVGWGNGYVAIPKDHPLYEKDYDHIESHYNINIHGGLTFASSSIKGQPEETLGMWIIGFDTAHSYDSLNNWPDEQSVMNEALKLKIQCEGLEISEHGKQEKIRDAAPDLLEALTQLMNRLTTHGNIDAIREEGPIEDARQAIIKATK